MEEKRKGYPTMKQQVEANNKYLANNPEARERKKVSNLKSNGKKFIKEFAKIEDLEEFKTLIKERETLLKNS